MATPALRGADVDSPYGVTAFVPSPTRWDRMAGAGIGWARCDFSWRMVETAPDVFNWSTTDEEVAQANARGIRIYAGLGYTPAWASNGGRSQDPPRDPADWYDYVYRCVSRYKASVHHWELWNEPNISGFWAGTRTQYINNILKVASDAAHAADPDCMVLAPEISECCNSSDWLRDVLQQAGDKVDIIAVHRYGGGDIPSGRISGIDSQHSYIVSLGYGNKPFWITECGWESDSAGMTEQKQADYLTQMLAGMTARSTWWHTFFWYQIWEGPTGRAGLLCQDETPKPSWYAYRDYTAAHPAPQRVSVNLSTADIYDGITRVVVGDGDTVPATQANRACRRNDNPAEDY
ncbi:MAG: cellulase family glycosylhydrolase, partial [Planctomycetes bacterium]|nr:cellulase family glycosylhydrolase [Planctomycetota bacterium]